MRKAIVWMVIVISIIAIAFAGIACKSSVTTQETSAEETVAEETVTEETVSEETTATTEGKEKFNIGYQIYYEGNSWSIQLTEEFKYALETKYADLVDNVYYVSDNFDTTKQMNNFDDLMAKGVDIIFITPLDPDSMKEKIKAAEEAGVKVIIQATALNGEDYTAYVNVNDFTQGKVMAEILTQFVTEGKVLILSGIAGTSTAKDIKNGFDEVLKNYPDIEPLPEVFTDWDYAKTKQATLDAFVANPDIAGILNHSATRAAAEALIESNIPLVPMSWGCLNGDLRTWLEYKELGLKTEALIKPAYISAIALDVGMNALLGKPFEKYNEVPVFTVKEGEIEKYYLPDVSDDFCVASYLPPDLAEQLFPKE